MNSCRLQSLHSFQFSLARSDGLGRKRTEKALATFNSLLRDQLIIGKVGYAMTRIAFNSLLRDQVDAEDDS